MFLLVLCAPCNVMICITLDNFWIFKTLEKQNVKSIDVFLNCDVSFKGPVCRRVNLLAIKEVFLPSNHLSSYEVDTQETLLANWCQVFSSLQKWQIGTYYTFFHHLSHQQEPKGTTFLIIFFLKTNPMLKMFTSPVIRWYITCYISTVFLRIVMYSMFVST